MVVDSAWQIGNEGRLGGEMRVAGLVRKTHHRIGIGDIKAVADQRHAERRKQAADELRTHLCHAVAIGIAQQGDAIGARHRRAGLFHHRALHLLAQPAAGFGIFGLGRLGRFGHQHIAVGQHVDPARVIQIARKRCNLQIVGRDGLGIGCPAFDRRHLDGGNQTLHRLGQLRVRPGPLFDRQRRRIAARGEDGKRHQRQRPASELQSGCIHCGQILDGCVGQ